jgi:hypothetical protein
MGFWYHYNRGSGSCKNMSVPPRTRFDALRVAVSKRVAVFSFPWAAYKFCSTTLNLDAFRHTDPSPTLAQIRETLLHVFPTPEAFFERVGQPIFPAWESDFLIGFRFGDQNGVFPEGVSYAFCEDPLLCAGVLSRCAGTLYLARRIPDLTWERILQPPLGFDDPLITL